MSSGLLARKASFFKGLHYKSCLFYSFLTFLKLGKDYDLRYKIASRYIKPGDFVLDVCAGPGRLVLFLPLLCKYTGIEASADFRSVLFQKGLACQTADLHDGLGQVDLYYDVIVMIISLCHFRQTSMDSLLESFKKIGKRVVIIEDVLPVKRDKGSFIQRAMDYFCSTDYYLPMELFTAEEFEAVMSKHSYSCQREGRRYMVACYEP